MFGMGKKSQVALYFCVCLMLLLTTQHGMAFHETENEISISIYDYRTGELMGSVFGTISSLDMYEFFEAENVPMQLWNPELGFGWGENREIGFLSTSTIAKIAIDHEEKKLYVWLEGPEGSAGKFTLFVTEELVPFPNLVEVYLDNEPIKFIIERLIYAEVWFDYLIHIEYTHSTRTLTISLAPVSAWHIQPPALIKIGIGAIVILGVLCWLKFRK